MTVSELISELSKYPPDMPVVATWEGVAAGIRAENFDLSKWFDTDIPETQLYIDVEDYR